jgi:hypothetical protein
MISRVAKFIIVAVLVSGSLTALIYWRKTHNAMRPVTHGAILNDLSDSMAPQDIPSILGLTQEFLNKPQLRAKSNLTVMTTGDDSSKGEPRFLVRYEVPFSTRALEGKGSILKRKKEILADLELKLKKLRHTNRSPIVLAVSRGIQELQGGGCGSGSGCFLFVRTDGEELSERSVKAAIEKSGNSKDLSAFISNEGINVIFCGLAETNDAANADRSRTPVIHDVRHEDHLQRVWRSLFSVPSFVTFEPYCPKKDLEEITGN